MRIYVASLSDYNNGDLEGTWIDLKKMSDGEDVLEAISDFLADLTKRKADGEKREEWAIHDFEGPRAFYQESGDEDYFDMLIAITNAAEENDIPEEVIAEYVRDYGSKKMDARDMEDLLSNFLGTADTFEDWVQEYVDDNGPEIFTTDWVWTSDALEMSDTDKCILAREISEMERENLEEIFDDEKKIEDAISDKYDEVYEALDDDAVGYMIDNGFADSEEDLVKEALKGRGSFFIDWGYVARTVEGNFATYDHKGDVYVFSNL